MTDDFPTLLQGLALSRPVLDRAEWLRKDPSELAARWARPDSKLVVISDDYAPADGDALAFTSPLDHAQTLPPKAMLMGLDTDGSAIFAIDSDPPQRIEGGKSLREMGARLGSRDAEVFTTALGLSQWHRRHPRCPVCGEPTEMIRSGWERKCPNDGSAHFPRTDPAVIMLIRDPQDRALLGRRAPWPEGWFSTLAGFIEPGESAEACVVREAMEEATTAVDRTTVQFLGSQPWPFPSSLMMGFHAYSLTSDDPAPGDGELAEARWFTRGELRELCESGEVKVPSAVSIARHLIERWYGDALPGEWSRP